MMTIRDGLGVIVDLSDAELIEYGVSEEPKTRIDEIALAEEVRYQRAVASGLERERMRLGMGTERSAVERLRTAVDEYVRTHEGASRGDAYHALSASRPELFEDDAPVSLAAASIVEQQTGADQEPLRRLQAAIDQHLAANPKHNRSQAVMALLVSNPELFDEGK